MGISPRTLRPSSTFTPRSISGLALWLDASDSSTLFQNSDGTVPATATSDPVGYWGDKSGNGRHAVQATAGSRPVVGSLNGRKAVTFDGTNDNLFVEDYSADSSLSGMTRFIAFDSDASASMIFATTSTSAKTANAGGGIWWQRFGSNWYGYSADAVRYHGGTADESPHIATNFFDGTLAASFGTRLQNYIDGALLPVVGSQGTLGTTTGASGAKLSIGSNLGINNFVNGKILEVLSYTRALTTAERQRLERYLAARWGITLAPTVSNADAQDWINRVYSNGGTVSSSTASAVNTFCESIESAGIRDRFYRMGIFAGSNLNAALVPLYRGPSLGGTQYGGTTDTNLGSPAFLVGDYNETGVNGGLLGNGTTKYLNTGFNVDQLPGAANCHLSSFITGTQDIATPRTLIGTLFNGVADRYRIFLNSTTAGNYLLFTELGVSSQASATRANANGGLMLASRTSTTLLTLYDDAVSVGTNETSTAAVTGASPFFVFARNGPTEYYNGRMAAYSIGAGMTAAQVTAYNTAIQAFQATMGRV